MSIQGSCLCAGVGRKEARSVSRAHVWLRFVRTCSYCCSMDRSSKQGLLDLGPSFMRSNVKYAWSSASPQHIYGNGRSGAPGALQYAHSLVGLTPRVMQGNALTASDLYKDHRTPSRALLRRTSSAPAQVLYPQVARSSHASALDDRTRYCVCLHQHPLSSAASAQACHMCMLLTLLSDGTVLQGRTSFAESRHASAGLRPLTPTNTSTDRASFNDPSRFGSILPGDMLVGHAMRIRSVSALQSSQQSRHLASTSGGARLSRSGGTISSTRSRPHSAGRSARRSADFAEASSPPRPVGLRSSGSVGQLLDGAAVPPAAAPGRLQARGGDRPGTPATSRAHSKRSNVLYGSAASADELACNVADDVKGDAARHATSRSSGGKDAHASTASWVLNSGGAQRPSSPQQASAAQCILSARSVGLSSEAGGRAAPTASTRDKPRKSGSRRTSATGHTASTANKVTHRRSSAHRSPTRSSRASSAERKAGVSSVDGTAAASRRRTADDHAALPRTRAFEQGVLSSSSSLEAFLRDSVASSDAARKRASKRRHTADNHLRASHDASTSSQRHERSQCASPCEHVDWHATLDSAVSLAAGAAAADMHKHEPVHVIADVSVVRKRVAADRVSLQLKAADAPPVFAPYQCAHDDSPGKAPPIALQLLHESHDFLSDLAGPLDLAELLSLASSRSSCGGSSAGSSVSVVSRVPSPEAQ